MKNKILYLISLFIVLTSCTNTPAISPTATTQPTPTRQPTNTQIVEDKTVIKIVTGEWAPYTGEKLLGGGLATEIVEATFKEMGQTVQFDFKPWERNLEEVKGHVYFGTFPWAMTEERKQLFLFSEPIISGSVNLFVKADSDIEFTTIEDLTGKTLCSPQQWTVYGFEEAIETGKIIREAPNDMESCLYMLQTGRVDMIPNEQLVMWMLIREMFDSTEDFKMLDPPLEVAEYYLLVSQTYPDGETQLAEFNQSLNKLKEEGKIQAIIDKHFSIPSSN